MGYSPLGRMMRHRIADRWRAESLFIVAVTGIALGLMLLNQFVWAFVREPVLANPGGAVAVGFWLSQLALGAGFFFGCAFGFKPAITITCTATGLQVEGTASTMQIAYREIKSVQRVTGLVYHRHFRRYWQTRLVVNRLQDEFTVLQAAGGPVVLGLTAEDRAAFETLVEQQLVPSERVIHLDPAQVA